MRGRALAGLAALFVVDLLVVFLGYRAHTGVLPPLQREAPAFEVDPTSEEQPTSAPVDADEVVGPALLSINAAGDVLRATRGACDPAADNAARIWTGNIDDGAALTMVEAPGISEVLGLMVLPGGVLRMSGLDDGCEPVVLDSTDAGASWISNATAGLWTLLTDDEATGVLNPAGDLLEAPCPSTQVVNLRRGRAVFSCESSTFFAVDRSVDPDTESAQALPAPDYADLSATAGFDEGTFFVFGGTAECTASFAVAVPAVPRVTEQECFEEQKAPLAIASAGDLLVIQLGNDLRVSRDQGETFDPVGETSPEDGETGAAS